MNRKVSQGDHRCDLDKDAEYDSQTAVGPQPAIAHNLQHPFAGAGRKHAITSVRQTVQMKPTGQQHQRQYPGDGTDINPPPVWLTTR
jgi:hypothetical protein